MYRMKYANTESYLKFSSAILINKRLILDNLSLSALLDDLNQGNKSINKYLKTNFNLFFRLFR